MALLGDLPDPLNVEPGTPVTITVQCHQTYGTASDEDDITRIQLNWTDSSPALALLTSSIWAWDDSNSHPSVLGLGTIVNDSNMSDGIVNRQNAGIGIAPASPFTIGTLSFSAPAVAGTYAVCLTGGNDANETSTAVLDGVHALTLGMGGLTVGDYSFTTVPEPTGMLLLLAPAGILLTRRRTKFKLV